MTFEGHKGEVIDVVFLDNRQIASASVDRTIKIWEASTKWCSASLKGH